MDIFTTGVVSYGKTALVPGGKYLESSATFAFTASARFDGVCPRRKLDREPCGRLAVVAGDRVVVFAPQLRARHVPKSDGRAVGVCPEHDVFKFLGVLSRVCAVMVALKLLAGSGGRAPKLARGDLGVLRLYRVTDVRRGEVVVVQLVRVEPDAHGVLGPEQSHVADALDPAERVLDVGGDVIGQVVPVQPPVLRDEAHHQQEVFGRLRNLYALQLHLLRQKRHGELQLVLHLHLGDVRVGPGVEGEGDGRGPGVVAGGGHVAQVVDAVHLLLDNLRHGVLDGLGRGPGVNGVDGYLRRRDRRILGDRQGLYRKDTRQHHDDRDHPREDGAVDEKS